MSYFRAYDAQGKLHRASIKRLDYRKDDILLDFSFNDFIKDEVKVMAGARWNPTTKCWTVKQGHRNRFAIDNLLGKPVFARYDAPLQQLTGLRDVAYQHQCRITSHFFYRRECIAGAEMGTGKTLSSIMFFEYLKTLLGNFPAWYVAPKTALMSVRMDYAKWKAGFYPQFMTLNELVKRATSGEQAPKVFIIDESSRVKSPDAKQSQACEHVANAMRDLYGDDIWVCLMSGSPAPKSPLDWWMQCEIARPGFLREGTPAKFKERVGLYKKMVGESGMAYPKLITWKDDPRKCGVCGKVADSELHHMDHMQAEMTRIAGQDLDTQPHKFIPMKDEVGTMYARMDGLVQITLKKDCLDLPEKVYTVRKCKPTKYMKSLAKMLVKTVPGAAQLQMQLRELSDGFQYCEELVGTRPCENCKATGTGTVSPDNPKGLCLHCAGKKEFKVYEQKTVEVETPKVEALMDLLEEKAEDGRLITFAAFQGTIDRISVNTVKAGWKFIRRDGRGWLTNIDGIKTAEDMVRYFQRDLPNDDKVNFVAHPKSAGMGLTLTASDTILYYSNSFDGEDRVQSEARNHRPGSRGCNIIDLEHLPIDGLVRENVKKKLDMQNVTMGTIQKCMEVLDDESDD